MLAARYRLPVITVALVVGTVGGTVTSITQALAAHPAAAARPGSRHYRVPVARPATVLHWAAGEPALSLAQALRIASIRSAPLVTDVARAGRSKRGLAAPPMSPAMLRANALRQAAARSYLATAHPPAARYLAATAQAQIRNYYCGPATVSEMLAQLGVVLSQPAAAKALGTNSSGTDWSNKHGYPVPRVLDAHQVKNDYVAVALPWTPKARQISTYIADLVTDLNHGAGVPLAGNAYEVPGGPHLVGHPPGQEIMHWFDIRGYADAGAITAYEDSVHGAPSIAWNATVPAYSTLPSSTIADILGARGYVW
jgi:hypothetical protein